MYKCPVCKSPMFSNFFNDMICDRCGCIFDSYLEIRGFDLAKLYNFVDNTLLENIRDEKEKEFLRGLFMAYFETIKYSKWKKSRKWAEIKIIDLIKQIINKYGLGDLE